jgi:lipid-A-disaccharide synthase
VEQFKPAMPSFSKKPIVAILPGSRKQEIKTKLPVMLQMASRFPDHQFIVAMAPGLPEDFYKSFLQKHPNTSAVKGLTYELLSQAKAALVTSGTATLETALFGVPEVVCYKGNPISYQIAKRLIKVPYISLVNLIMEKQVVKELIQDEMNENTLYKELNLLLNNNDYTNTMKMQYTLLRNMLTQKGSASQSAAKEILQML